MKPAVHRLIECAGPACSSCIARCRRRPADRPTGRIGCNVRGIWPKRGEAPRDVDVFQLVGPEEVTSFAAQVTGDELTRGDHRLREPDGAEAAARQQRARRRRQQKPIRSFGILSSLLAAPLAALYPASSGQGRQSRRP